MNSLVSIISPCYNNEKFIAHTIQSVLSQTYSNWELLIVDDCSTDRSYEIAKAYAEKDSRIKVLKNEQKSGAAISRNLALDNAMGEYVAFLDSDDLWEKEKLQKQISFMKENNSDFCFTKYSLIDENDNHVGKTAKVIKHLTFGKYVHHCFTGCLTVIYKKSVAPDVRSFNIKNNNDYGLFLQVMKNVKNALGYDEVLAYYRIRKTSISRNKVKKIKPYFELMHKYLKFPYFICCWFLITNIFIGKIWKYEKENH